MTDERYRENRVAVAERDDQLVGIAMSGPPLDAAAAWARQLYVLYVYAADHGTGAGSALLKAVVDPEESAALSVADPNLRAKAFYRKHGFVERRASPRTFHRWPLLIDACRSSLAGKGDVTARQDGAVR